MHPTVLDAMGYALLLSSFVTFLILLRLGCKHWKKKSPFYLLSTSDVFSSTLTAIILLVNHIGTGIKMNYNWQSNDRMPNYTWMLENRSQHQFPPFLQIHNLREAVDNTDLDVSLTCDLKDIFMQYGMLLAALVNAFVSLLTFVVQCNLSATCVKRRYASMIESSKTNDTRLDSKDTPVRKRRMSRDEQESTAFRQQSNINASKRSNVIRRFVRGIVKICKFQMPQEDDEKSVGYLITAHWLVPFLVVGILYFAKHDDMNATRYTEDTECMFESNFPLSDFHVFSAVENNSHLINSIAHLTLENNYLFDAELLNKSKPSNVEIDQIISRVQNIIRIMLNTSRGNSTENVEAINFLGLENMTDRVMNNTNIDAVIQMLHGTSMDHHRNAASEETASTSGSLGNVSKISVNEGKKNSHQEVEEEITQMYFTNITNFTEEDASRKINDIPIVRNETFVSNDQIYADIMKRIQAASMHSSATKNYHDLRGNGKQPERNGPRNYSAKRKPYSIRHLLPRETDRFNQYVNSTMTKRDSQINLEHMTNRCLLSMEFLRLHLLALSLVIYFLPILLFCMLHMRAMYTCKNARAMLRAYLDFASTLPRSNTDSNKKKIDMVDIDKSPCELELSADDKRAYPRSSMEESDMPQGSDITQSHAADIEMTSECHESHIKMQGQNTLELDCMVRILDTIRLSLILCILLWTPMFVGILLRTFSCTHAPRWWNNITFSSAISFGIIRNALNVSIMKIQKVCGDAGAKENKVHPIK